MFKVLAVVLILFCILGILLERVKSKQRKINLEKLEKFSEESEKNISNLVKLVSSPVVFKLDSKELNNQIEQCKSIMSKLNGPKLYLESFDTQRMLLVYCINVLSMAKSLVEAKEQTNSEDILNLPEDTILKLKLELPDISFIKR